MFIEERQKDILDIIESEGKITVAVISERYGISDESARRDLRILEQKGLCKRTHGGAVSLNKIRLSPPDNRQFNIMPIHENYRAIAEYSASLLEANDTVYLTSGSFGYIMLSYLPKDKNFTLVVNSVDIAQALRDFGNIDVFIAGGKMRKSGSLVNTMATEFISRMHFDKCFITGSGLTSDFGLSNGTDETATFQRTVINNSRKKYLLLPSSKIGANAFIKVCDTKEFDEIITDSDCNEEQLGDIERLGVKITVVGDTE